VKIKKPRVVVIGLKGLPAYGGAAAVGENIILKLKDEFDFTVLSIASHTTEKSADYKGIRQVVFNNYLKGGLNTLFYYLRSLLYCMTHRFDLVHLHHAESGFITPILRLRYKVIVTFHGVCFENDPKFSKFQNRFFRFSEKLNVRFANEAISVSKPDQDFILNKYKKMIGYIPNGISVNTANPEKNRKKTETPYIFFAAGRIYQIKGLHLLLQAIRKINPDIPIKVAGDLEQVDAYRDKIIRLSEGLNIEYVGLIKDKEELLEMIAGSLLFVFPSLREAMSMMLLEVVSVKTPVIASNIPSNRTIFTDEEMLFFESKCSRDLTEKLRYALANPEEMEKRAQKAFDKLTKEYTWDIVSGRYKSIYKQYLKK